MPKIKYAIETRGDKRLEISWKGVYKNTTVRLDGLSLATIENRKALKQGKEIELPEGEVLYIVLQNNQLLVSKNGKPLPGSQGDPDTMVSAASNVMYVIGGLYVLVGLIAELGEVAFLTNLGIGYLTAAFGALYIVNGYFISKRQLWTLYLGLVLVCVDLLAGIYSRVEVFSEGGRAMRYSYGFFAIRIAMFIAIFKAIKPMKEQIRREANTDILDQDL